MLRSASIHLVLLPAVLLALLLAVPAAAEDDQPVSEAARKTAIKKLGKELRKQAKSPHATKHKEEMLAILESLEVLGGPEAGVAALGAVAFDDKEVRDAAFELAETLHDKSQVKPLTLMLEDKRYSKDEDVRTWIARMFSVIADPSTVAPLTDLIRTDEYPLVVAAAAESLAVYGGAPLPMRKEAVKRLINTYTSTWNLMMSIRPEDKVIGARMRKQWKIYGRSIRSALQALTGEQTLQRPQEWREWWNEHKKRRDW